MCIPGMKKIARFGLPSRSRRRGTGLQVPDDF